MGTVCSSEPTTKRRLKTLEGSVLNTSGKKKKAQKNQAETIETFASSRSNSKASSGESSLLTSSSKLLSHSTPLSASRNRSPLLPPKRRTKKGAANVIDDVHRVPSSADVSKPPEKVSRSRRPTSTFDSLFTTTDFVVSDQNANSSGASNAPSRRDLSERSVTSGPPPPEGDLSGTFSPEALEAATSAHKRSSVAGAV